MSYIAEKYYRAYVMKSIPGLLTLGACNIFNVGDASSCMYYYIAMGAPGGRLISQLDQRLVNY